MLFEVEQWILDIDTIIEKTGEMEQLAGKTVLITGASGLICSALIDTFFRYNDTHKGKIKIIAAGRSYERMKKRFGALAERDDFRFIRYDATDINCVVNVSADFVIHGASNAFPAIVMREPVETLMANIMGLKTLLDYSRDYNVKRLLYISSSEVYGQKAGKEAFGESDYGFIDILNERNSYSMGKRAAETMCASYHKEYGVDFIIARPGHIYGPTASQYDSRVSSAWPYAVSRGEDIVMKSKGEQLRSYCYCLDCASALIKMLINGESAHAYNISNPDSIITIADLAYILTESAGTSLIFERPTEQEQHSFNPMNNSSLKSTSLESLGWEGIFSADTGLKHTVQILKCLQGLE